MTSADEPDPVFVMCKLDNDTQLVSTTTSFVIQKRINAGKSDEQWVSRFYYTEIGDALRGYVKHTLRSAETAQALTTGTHTLLTAVEKLEKRVADISAEVHTLWKNHMKDPIQSYLLRVG